MSSNRRILAFSPGTASKHSSVFDKPDEEIDQLCKSFKRSWPCKEGKLFRTPTRRRRKICTILSSELEDPVVPGLFCLSSSNISLSLRYPSDAWAKRFHELPVVHLAAFLDVRSCIRLQRVCQSWRSGLSTESVYKLLYRRCLLPQRIGKRSYARSWKTLFLSHSTGSGSIPGVWGLGPGSLLKIRHSHVFFDFCSNDGVEGERFEPSRANHALGQPRAPTIAALELLPGFFWCLIQTAGGLMQCGVVVRDSHVVQERGLATASAYLDSLSSLRSMSVRALVLLLASLGALPAGVSPNAVCADPDTTLCTSPLRLQFRLSSRTTGTMYMYNRPAPHRPLPAGEPTDGLMMLAFDPACQCLAWTFKRSSGRGALRPLDRNIHPHPRQIAAANDQLLAGLPRRQPRASSFNYRSSQSSALLLLPR